MNGWVKIDYETSAMKVPGGMIVRTFHHGYRERTVAMVYVPLDPNVARFEDFLVMQGVKA